MKPVTSAATSRSYGIQDAVRVLIKTQGQFSSTELMVELGMIKRTSKDRVRAILNCMVASGELRRSYEVWDGRQGRGFMYRRGLVATDPPEIGVHSATARAILGSIEVWNGTLPLAGLLELTKRYHESDVMEALYMLVRSDIVTLDERGDIRVPIVNGLEDLRCAAKSTW